jgi:hypothetical protein
MTPQVEARLNDLIEPVRDQAVGELLQALAADLDSGAEVVAEPVERDPSGRVVRDGELNLPRRRDLRVTRGRRTIHRRVETPVALQFEPLCMVGEGGFTTVISPFRWEAAELLVETSQARPSWSALRLWYLEWFQSRFGDLAPDLDGAVHSVTGPRETAEGFRLTVDFGSAPLGAFMGLIAAVEESGAMRLRVGQES